MKRETEFDYIVVGTGASGSTVAGRLSEDPNVSVLVLESGGSDRDPLISIPKGFYFLYGGKKHSFYYSTLPVGPSQNIERWQRGRVLGGSTAINGLQYERGSPSYWDRVAARGNEGWSWSDMVTAFRAFENHELGAGENRGKGGPLHLQINREPDELNEAIFTAAEKFGLERVEDINSSSKERVGYIPNTIHKGRRVTAARAFLKPVLNRDNLSLELNAHVGWILFDGNRAAGVRVKYSNGKVRDIYAKKEIIISAGAIETPLLLERSGIGNAEVLSKIGVPILSESPNVGEHAIEQRQVAYQAKINKRIGYNSQLSSTMKMLFSGSKYLLNRKGVIGSGAYDIGAFFKSDPNLDYADILGIFNPLSLDLSAPALKVSKEPGFSAAGMLLHPTTESSVHSSGSQPENPPIIDSHYLETEYDRKSAYEALKGIRAIAEQSPLSDLIEIEESPGSQVQSPDDVINHAWLSGHILHTVGTCRMGPNTEDVVDSRLKVRGIKNLRIADASVLPIQPGNTMGPSIAVGWRAAEFSQSDNE